MSNVEIFPQHPVVSEDAQDWSAMAGLVFPPGLVRSYLPRPCYRYPGTHPAIPGQDCGGGQGQHQPHLDRQGAGQLRGHPPHRDHLQEVHHQAWLQAVLPCRLCSDIRRVHRAGAFH